MSKGKRSGLSVLVTIIVVIAAIALWVILIQGNQSSIVERCAGSLTPIAGFEGTVSESTGSFHCDGYCKAFWNATSNASATVSAFGLYLYDGAGFQKAAMYGFTNSWEIFLEGDFHFQVSATGIDAWEIDVYSCTG